MGKADMHDAFEGKKILVVGGAGFVGSNLCLQLLEAGAGEVIIIDNLLSAERSNVPDDERITFHHASINDSLALSSIPTDLDYAFHLSTYHGNQSSIADPLADHEHNTLTTLKLCERLRNFKNLKKVVYAGAGCTVAEKTFDEAGATGEDAPVSLYLDSPYQISKIIGEFYGNYYFMRHGLPFVKARFQNVYGPREVLGAGQWRGTPATIWRNVTPTFIWKSLHHEALPVENNGIATRDFIYVEDIARGLMACAAHGEAGEVYNLASGVETSIRELAETINALTENPTPIALEAARNWDRSGKRFGDTAKAKEQIGFEAKTSLRQGLRQTIDWTRAHREEIATCIARHTPRLNDLAAAA